MIKKILLLLGAGLLARLGQGQVMTPSIPTYNPPAIPMQPVPGADPFLFMRSQPTINQRTGEGSYQTPDGAWHTVEKATFDATKLTTKDKAGKLSFTTATVRQFEIARDTFIVLGNLPGRAQNTKPEFLESVFYQRGMRVLRLVSENSVQTRFFLQLPQAPLQLLPSRKEDFKKAMLLVVQSCPVLVSSLTEDAFGPKDVVAIMVEYAKCK